MSKVAKPVPAKFEFVLSVVIFQMAFAVAPLSRHSAYDQIITAVAAL
jgi:hypothetical protein